jgi:hypothetical protein
MYHNSIRVHCGKVQQILRSQGCTSTQETVLYPHTANHYLVSSEPAHRAPPAGIATFLGPG